MEFECTECANILASLHLLEKHMHIIHKLPLWTPVEHEIRRYYGCRICLRRGFRTSQLLIDHQRLAHRVQRDQGDTLAGDEQREDAVMVQRLLQCEFCTLVFRDPKMHKIHRDLHLDARQPISKNSVKTIRIDENPDEEGSSDEDGVPFTVDDEDDEEENGVDKDEDDYYADEYLNADLIPNNHGEQHSIHNDVRKLYCPRRIIGGGRGSRGSHVKSYPRFCCVFCRKPLQSAEELREHMVNHNNINPQVEARTGASTSMVGLRNSDEIPMGQSKPGPGRPRKNFSVPIIVRRSRKRVGILERLEAKKSKENLEGELIGMPPDSVDEGNGDCADGKAEKDNFSRRSTRLAKPNRKQNLSNLSRGLATKTDAAISVPMNDMQINEKETGHIPADMPELIIHD